MTAVAITSRQSWTSAIAVGAIAAIALHLMLRFAAAEPDTALLPLYAVLILGGIPLTYELLRKAARRQFGSDLLAGISIVTAVILGEYLAGSIVVLMLAGGEALEAYALRTASSVLEALASDYARKSDSSTTPQTIQQPGAFGGPAPRPGRLERLKWALDRTVALGLADLMLHAGFLPEPGDPDRKPFLDTLARVSDLARAKGVTVAFETGQETADLLRLTLDELKCPNLKVNFDPANMLLYDKGDPIRAVEILGPDIRSVHVKDANRPTVPGQWGEEVPLGRGQANIKGFIQTLKKVGYGGPLCIEREVGDQPARIRDIATA